MKTQLTERLGLSHPIIQAPMAFVAGGTLAAAVSRVGGLGLIGGGYGDSDWIEQQFEHAGNTPVGCGLITWKLAEQPALLDRILERAPKALFLSFGDPAPFADRIKSAGVTLMCQIQTLRDAQRAIDIEADVIVAQGAEAGGHGEMRGTMALVPEVADAIGRANSQALLCAAGGIADGRGLAAALMLGADGVVIGTRFVAAEEALIHSSILSDVLHASGDETVRTKIPDILRGFAWPGRYSIRVRKNDFVAKWHGQEKALMHVLDAEKEFWTKAQTSGDPSIAAGIVGEAVGLVHRARPAGEMIDEIVREATELLERNNLRQLSQAIGRKQYSPI